MSFTEISSKVSDVAKSENKNGFDIDKRADISQAGKDSTEKGFDIDKRASLDENRSAKSEPLENRFSANDVKDVPEKGDPIPNKIEGMRRELEVKEELEKQYPQKNGYSIISEVYLRNENGERAIDTLQTGEGRRIDFVVVKGGKVVDSIEVTSMNVDKTDQSAKENRIRENGGNYIKVDDSLIRIPDNVRTRIERRP